MTKKPFEQHRGERTRTQTILESLEPGMLACGDMSEMKSPALFAVGETALLASVEQTDESLPREAGLREPNRPLRKQKRKLRRAPAVVASFAPEHLEQSAKIYSMTNRKIHNLFGKVLASPEPVRLLDLRAKLKGLAHPAMNDDQAQARTSRRIRKKKQE